MVTRISLNEYHSQYANERMGLIIEGMKRVFSLPEMRFTLAAEILNNPVWMMPDYNVPVARVDDSEFAAFVPLFHDILCHGEVAADWHGFLDSLPDPNYLPKVMPNFLQLQQYIATETLTLPGFDHTKKPDDSASSSRYSWTVSPVSNTDQTFDQFLLNLTKKRRGNLKTAMRKWSEPEYTFQQEPYTDDLLVDRLMPNLLRRHPFKSFHPARMLSMAVAYNSFDQADWFTIRASDGTLMATFFCLHEPNGFAVFQGIIKNELADTRSIGQAGLGYMVNHYCQDPRVKWFDPTCITQPFEGDMELDIYKRMVAETPAYRPSLLAIFDEESRKTSFAPYFDGVLGCYVALSEDEPEKISWTPNKFPDLVTV